MSGSGKTKGKPTRLAHCVVCQCGAVEMVVDKKMRRSVALRCAKCGLPVSVKGSLTEVRVSSSEIAYAISSKLVEPEVPEPGEGEAGKGKSESGQIGVRDKGYRSFRFRVSIEQDAVVQRALEVVRLMNWSNEEFRVQSWQGAGLECICADFLAGADPQHLAIVDAMDDEVKRETERVREELGETLSVRRQRDIKARTRERLLNPPTEEEERAGRRDKGRLLKAVKLGFSEYAEELGELVECSFRTRGHFGDCIRLWEKYGGFLLRVEGDPRISTPSGERPRVYVWMEMDESPDLAASYRSIMASKDDGEPIEDATLEITELLYKEQIEQWEMPRIAGGRLAFKIQEEIDG